MARVGDNRFQLSIVNRHTSTVSYNTEVLENFVPILEFDKLCRISSEVRFNRTVRMLPSVMVQDINSTTYS